MIDSNMLNGDHPVSPGLSNLKGYLVILTIIFLWHESEDINKKCLLPKFQSIPILRFQVMHDNVYFIAPIDYCAA